MSDQALALFGTNENAPVPAYSPEDSNLGNENVSQGDVQIPRIAVLNALSPQMDTVTDAKVGLLYNSLNDELMEAVYCINLFYVKEFGVFKHRDFGGGFQGSYDSQAGAEAHVATLTGTPDQYQIFETARHTVLLLDAEGKPRMPAHLLMKGTNLSVSRNWNSQITEKGAGRARFSTVWTLGSAKRTGGGNTWYVYDVDYAGDAPEGLYLEAKDMYLAVKQQ